MTTAFNEVMHVLENYKQAVLERDVDRFLSSYATDVHVFDCWESWAYVGKDSLKSMVSAWFGGLKEENVVVKVHFDDMVIEESANVAFVHCKVTFAEHQPTGEKIRQMVNRFTFGLKRENGWWRICHEHSSLPIQMESGKAVMDGGDQ